jgi:hypothetical protein
MDTGSFPGVKSGRGVTLTPHPRLVLWSYKSRAIPLLPLWAVRPVQSLRACTRVHITFIFTFSVLITYLSLESNIGCSIRTQSLYPMRCIDSRFYPYWLTLCNLGATQVFTAASRTSQKWFVCKNSTVSSRSRKREVKHVYYPKQAGPNVRHSLTCDVVITGFQTVHKTKHHKAQLTSDGPLCNQD